jgi:predicted amidophosphoribosyltransferase
MNARLELKRLVRSRATRPQADLDYGERHRNVEDAFSLRRGRRAADRAHSIFSGERCLLVDDVATTGHTLVAALRALQEAGPGDTAAAVFALA